MKYKTALKYVLSIIAGIVFMLLIMSGRGEAHDCGFNGGWQDGYIQDEIHCWQEAYADANGGITYITVCN